MLYESKYNSIAGFWTEFCQTTIKSLRFNILCGFYNIQWVNRSNDRCIHRSIDIDELPEYFGKFKFWLCFVVCLNELTWVDWMEYYGVNSAMQRIDTASDWNSQPESSLEGMQFCAHCLVFREKMCFCRPECTWYAKLINRMDLAHQSLCFCVSLVRDVSAG